MKNKAINNFKHFIIDYPKNIISPNFNSIYSKKKYGEIWGFIILIMDLILAVNTHIWKVKHISLLFIILIILFILALFLINRGLLADKEKELN